MDGVNPDDYPKDLGSYPRNEKGEVHMVMNDNGPVTNNDIEMVILAFQTGERQNYQLEGKNPLIQWILGTTEISTAIGRGN